MVAAALSAALLALTGSLAAPPKVAVAGAPARAARRVGQHADRMQFALAGHSAAIQLRALSDTELSSRFHASHAHSAAGHVASAGTVKAANAPPEVIRSHCRACEIAKDREVRSLKTAIKAHGAAESEESQMGGVNGAFDEARTEYSSFFDEWSANKTALVQEHGLARNLVENQKFGDPFDDISKEFDLFGPMLDKLKEARIGVVAARAKKDRAADDKAKADARYKQLVDAAANADKAAETAEGQALKACEWMVYHLSLIHI